LTRSLSGAVTLSDRFYDLEGHFAIDLDGARAVFSTRRGGYSVGPYESLNLGLLTEDQPTAVTKNRRAARSQSQAPPLSFVHQVHGPDVLRLQRGDQHPGVWPDEGRPLPVALPKVDAQATTDRDVALVALVADCLPIALAAPGAVAMLHAGWRGLHAGIIAAGVRAVRELSDGDGELSAAVGPGAGPCCYEVGPEVHAAFADVPGAHAADNLDLKAIARDQLSRAGVASIADIGICTICSPDLLFSHRRDHGVTGRQAGIAWLT
jgi:polyphenol oxidase